MLYLRHLLTITAILLATFAWAQDTGKVKGVVYDDQSQPMPSANIKIKGTESGTVTDTNGNFELEVPANREVIVEASFIGFDTRAKTVTVGPGEVETISFLLPVNAEILPGVEIGAERYRGTAMRRIEPKLLDVLVGPSGNFEDILKSQPGVSSNNELTSQYSVRGGNFDENLVYVNGIQVYRPFLVRSGQQEGLSFVNSNLVSDILFSTGGFEAKYGDKMSSVLDITYKEPREFAGSFSLSLLGGSAHIEDATDNLRFTQIHGIRYKSNQYLLGSLDTQGEYAPSFADYQGFFTYMARDNLKFSLLTNVSRNRYRFIPETRQSEFGTVNEALRLTVYFQGQEIDDFETVFGAFATDWQPRPKIDLRWSASAFRTRESETFDILGSYFLDQLENDLSRDDFGDVAFNLGVGSFLNHARNFLTAHVINASHTGHIHKKFGSEWLWGLSSQTEIIEDQLREWTLLDSSGFSLPQTPPDSVVVFEFLNSKNELQSYRTQGYFQHNHKWLTRDTSELMLTAGVRATHWTLNNELLVSPRVNLSYRPNWKRDWQFRAAWGYYSQPAFFREYRDFAGQLNTNIKAQTSIHYVVGADHNFRAWNRPFKLVTELYYKQLNNLIPYEVDNVRIRYYADNLSEGYSTGIDLKVNGEFVKGVDSWFSLSVLETKEDIKNDFYWEYFNEEGQRVFPNATLDPIVDSTRVEPGFIPRPTDQRVNVGIFFQDYLPKFPTYKMNLNLLFGSGLPFGPPTFERYKDTLRIPPYRRVDIGFSKQLIKEGHKLPEKNPFRHFKNMWLSLEVFNLLQVNNTISYLWVRDVRNRQYAIPNYLTARRVNLKLVARF